MTMLQILPAEHAPARIKVIGVGGGGGNALNHIVNAGLEGVDFIAANTDMQALAHNLAPYHIQLGAQKTRGLGAGADPEVGREAAEEDIERIRQAIEGADMVFITAGMGGGTGTGAAPVIARTAREMGVLTVAVVTRPFSFEARSRGRRADAGIKALSGCVDSIIVIPNDKVVEMAHQEMTMQDAYREVDNVLLEAVRCVTDVVQRHCVINVDFADVCTVMRGKGRALMTSGQATGERRAIEASRMALSSPLLENNSIAGATNILINFVHGEGMLVREVQEAASLISNAADPTGEADVIFGEAIDESMNDGFKVTLIATGFPEIVEQKETLESMRERTLGAIVRPRRRVSEINPRPEPPKRVTGNFQFAEDLQTMLPLNSSASVHAARHGSSPVNQQAADIGLPPEHAEDEYDIPAFLRKNEPKKSESISGNGRSGDSKTQSGKS
ncbi:MAG: Cell division protein FtsZ [Myxococcota bacterium]|nr:Cell division protein FtsZ [Myxococcota bacterium]